MSSKSRDKGVKRATPARTARPMGGGAAQEARRQSEVSRVQRERDAERRQGAMRRMEDAGHIRPPLTFR